MSRLTLRRKRLTTTPLTTTYDGTLPGSIKYGPFGVCLESQGSIGTDRLFTGQRLDSTGLYYYGARYYDPAIGRFISPDPVVQNFKNPQTLNRYSYCLNNPLKYVDPTGLVVEFQSEDGDCIVVVDETGIVEIVSADGGITGEVLALLEAWFMGGSVDTTGAYARVEGSSNKTFVSWGSSTKDWNQGGSTIYAHSTSEKGQNGSITNRIELNPSLRNLPDTTYNLAERATWVAHEVMHAAFFGQSRANEIFAFTLQTIVGRALGLPNDAKSMFDAVAVSKNCGMLPSFFTNEDPVTGATWSKNDAQLRIDAARSGPLNYGVYATSAYVDFPPTWPPK